MARPPFDIGSILWLAVACVPFYFYGALPAPTLVFVLGGSVTAYVGRQMPMAKQLMLRGFFTGIVATGLVSIAARRLGYVFMVTSLEIAWWSAWFAFCWAPLTISVVLRVRGTTRGES